LNHHFLSGLSPFICPDIAVHPLKLQPSHHHIPHLNLIPPPKARFHNARITNTRNNNLPNLHNQQHDLILEQHGHHCGAQEDPQQEASEEQHFLSITPSLQHAQSPQVHPSGQHLQQASTFFVSLFSIRINKKYK